MPRCSSFSLCLPLHKQYQASLLSSFHVPDPQKPRLRRNTCYCFRPLCLGVICYVAINNRNNHDPKFLCILVCMCVCVWCCVHNWPLNSMGLNCAGPLYTDFLLPLLSLRQQDQSLLFLPTPQATQHEHNEDEDL